MSLDLSAEDRKALAKDLAAELDTGRYGSRFVLSRRQLLSIAGGSAGVAGLVALGVDPATAQSAAGQVGTSSEPVDTFAYDLDVQGALQRDLDAGGQAITNVGSVSTDSVNTGSATVTNQVDAGSVNTDSLPDTPNFPDDATKDLNPDQEALELVGYIDLTDGGNSAHTFPTVSLGTDEVVIIEVLRFANSGDLSARLGLTIEEAAADAYNYTQEDELLSASTSTGAPDLELLSVTQRSGVFDGAESGVWQLHLSNEPNSTPRLSIFGDASSGYWELSALRRGAVMDDLSGDVTLTVEGSGDGDVALTAAVWKTRPRGGV